MIIVTIEELTGDDVAVSIDRDGDTDNEQMILDEIMEYLESQSSEQVMH